MKITLIVKLRSRSASEKLNIKVLDDSPDHVGLGNIPPVLFTLIVRFFYIILFSNLVFLHFKMICKNIVMKFVNFFLLSP